MPQDYIQQKLKEFDELWNEHDGTHFYKDEWRSFLTASLNGLVEKIREEIEGMKLNYQKEAYVENSRKKMTVDLELLDRCKGYNTALNDVLSLPFLQPNKNK